MSSTLYRRSPNGKTRPRFPRPSAAFLFGGDDIGSVSDLKLVRCPRSLAATLVTLPSMSLIPFAPFSFSFRVVVPQLRDEGGSEFETPSLPTLPRCCPRSFTFYVAHPICSIQMSAFFN